MPTFMSPTCTTRPRAKPGRGFPSLSIAFSSSQGNLLRFLLGAVDAEIERPGCDRRHPELGPRVDQRLGAPLLLLLCVFGILRAQRHAVGEVARRQQERRRAVGASAFEQRRKLVETPQRALLAAAGLEIPLRVGQHE
jgi:hypothetical protein